MTVILGSLESA